MYPDSVKIDQERAEHGRCADVCERFIEDLAPRETKAARQCPPLRMIIEPGCAEKRELTKVREEAKRFSDVIGPTRKVYQIVFADMDKLARHLVKALVNCFTANILIEKNCLEPRQVRSSLFDYAKGFVHAAVVDNHYFGWAAHRIGVAAQRLPKEDRAVPVQHDRAD